MKKSSLTIEHNVKVIYCIRNIVYVLNAGKNLAVGTPEEIQKNDRVLEAYPGGTGEKPDREKTEVL